MPNLSRNVSIILKVAATGQDKLKQVSATLSQVSKASLGSAGKISQAEKSLKGLGQTASGIAEKISSLGAKTDTLGKSASNTAQKVNTAKKATEGLGNAAKGSLAKLESFKKLEQNFQKVSGAMATAKQSMRALYAEMRASKDGALGARMEKASQQTQKLTRALDSQKTKLGIVKDELALAKTAYEKYGKAMQDGGSAKELARLGQLDTALKKTEIRYRKQELLVRETSKSLKEASGKARQLGEAYKKSVDPRVAKQYQASKTEVSKLSKSLNTLKKQLDASRSSLQKQGKAAGDTAEKINKAKKAVEGFGNAAGRAKKKTDQFGKSTEKIGDSLGRVQGAVGTAVGALASMALPVIESALFERKMKEVKAVSKATGEEFEALKERAREMGRTTEFSALQSAEGLKMLTMAGLSASEAITALPSALNLAIVGNMELGQAADYATNIMGGFQLGVEDLSRVTDVLANTSTSSNSTISELAEAMSYAAPAAAAMGVPVEEVAAAMGILHDKGIKASRAGTGMRGMMIRLAKPTRAARKALKRLGVEIAYLDDGSLDLHETMQRLHDAGMGLKESAQIFGVYAANAGLILSANTDRLKEFTEENDRATGALARMTKEFNDSTIGAWRNFKASVSDVTIEIGSHFLPVVTDTLKSFTALTNSVSFMTKSLPNFTSEILTIGGALATATSLIWLGGKAFSGLARIMSGITILGPQLGAALVPLLTRNKELIASSRLAVGGLSALQVTMAQLLAGIGALLIAWGVGLDIGNWLNQFSIFEKLGLTLIYLCDRIRLAVKKMWKALTFQDTSGVNKEIEDAINLYNGMLDDIDKRAKEKKEKKEKEKEEKEKGKKKDEKKQKNTNNQEEKSTEQAFDEMDNERNAERNTRDEELADHDIERDEDLAKLEDAHKDAKADRQAELEEKRARSNDTHADRIALIQAERQAEKEAHDERMALIQAEREALREKWQEEADNRRAELEDLREDHQDKIEMLKQEHAEAEADGDDEAVEKLQESITEQEKSFKEEETRLEREERDAQRKIKQQENSLQRKEGNENRTYERKSKSLDTKELRENKRQLEENQRAKREQAQKRAEKRKEAAKGKKEKEEEDRIEEEVGKNKKEEEERERKEEKKNRIIARSDAGGSLKDREEEQEQKRAEKKAQFEEEQAKRLAFIKGTLAGDEQKQIDKLEEARTQASDSWLEKEKENATKAESIFEEYTRRIKQLSDEAADRNRQNQEDLIDLDPLASEETKWKRRAQLAKEYEEQAKEAMAAGDYDKALELTSKATDAYKKLQNKSGKISESQVKNTVYSGVKSSGELAAAIEKLMAQSLSKQGKQKPGVALSAALNKISGATTGQNTAGKAAAQIQAVKPAQLSQVGAESITNKKKSAGMGEAQKPLKTIELSFKGGSLHGSEESANALLDQLAKAGMRA